MGPRVADTGLITTSALAVIAILAIVTVVGIVWGMRLKRRRDAAGVSESDRIQSEAGSSPDAPIEEPRLVSPSARAAQPRPEPDVPPPAPSPATAGADEREPNPPADEPIAAAAPLDASPATVADPTPMADPAPTSAPAQVPQPSLGDEPVTLLKGLGPKVAARLADLGVTTVGDMAALDTTQAETIDAHLGPFTGRMARDRWIEQARFLAAGDVKGFEAVFGRL